MAIHLILGFIKIIYTSMGIHLILRFIEIIYTPMEIPLILGFIKIIQFYGNAFDIGINKKYLYFCSGLMLIKNNMSATKIEKFYSWIDLKTKK